MCSTCQAQIPQKFHRLILLENLSQAGASLAAVARGDQAVDDEYKARVKHLVEELRVQQGHVAHELGAGESHLSKWLKGIAGLKITKVMDERLVALEAKHGIFRNVSPAHTAEKPLDNRLPASYGSHTNSSVGRTQAGGEHEPADALVKTRVADIARRLEAFHVKAGRLFADLTNIKNDLAAILGGETGNTGGSEAGGSRRR